MIKFLKGKNLSEENKKIDLKNRGNYMCLKAIEITR